MCGGERTQARRRQRELSVSFWQRPDMACDVELDTRTMPGSKVDLHPGNAGTCQGSSSTSPQFHFSILSNVDVMERHKGKSLSSDMLPAPQCRRSKGPLPNDDSVSHRAQD